MTGVAGLIVGELAKPVDARATRAAAAIAGPYGDAAVAVLFYGSVLRSAIVEGQMLDFYLIVSDYTAAYGKSWLARANRLLPPNVFPFEQDGVAAKYAVLSEADLARLCGPEADNVSVWARFAQPIRLVWQKDAAAADRVIQSLARAPETLLAHTAPVPGEDVLERWRRGFTLTYGAELRAERGDRPGSIVDFDPDWYRALSAALPDVAPLPDLDARWVKLRRRGKRLTLARLAKASFTFAGGIDYLAWKISRHSGARIEIKPWQRRWPIVGAITLLPRLLRSGSIR